MQRYFLKTPTAFLFVASLLPTFLIDTQTVVWTSVVIILIIFFSLWVYSITYLLLGAIETEPQSSFKNFTMVLSIAVCYTLALSIYFIQTYDSVQEPTWILLIFIIGNFFLGYAYFFILGFVAKIVATAELKKKPVFEDYIVIFLALILFPIGIWWLNPKIKRLVN